MTIRDDLAGQPDPESQGANPTAARSGLPSGILASRIAVDHDGPPPSIDDLGLREGKNRAFEWLQQRSHARLNDVHGFLSGVPGARWVLETHAIVGVVAEQVLVAIEAEIEKTICAAALAAVPDLADDLEYSRVAHYSRSLRFFSEG